MEIRKVGVAGCGLMGSGIAQISAASGKEVVVLETSEELFAKGLGRIKKFLAKSVQRGKMTEEESGALVARVSGTTKPEDLADCDIVVEAIIEQEGEKRTLFGRLDAACKPETIFSSNTSSLSISKLADTTRRPERFVGLHFFNPVPLMKLVEVVRAERTTDEVYETALNFTRELGKTPVRTLDTTGFIVNRLLVPYLLDAVRAVEARVGSIEDIDTGMVLGCGHPMGPLTLLDLVGVDTTAYIADIMHEAFGEARFARPALLDRMAREGLHGRKAGKGFYDYSGEKPVPNNDLLR